MSELVEVELNVRLLEYGVAASPNKFSAAFTSNDELLFVVLVDEDIVVVGWITGVFCVGGNVGYTTKVSLVGVASLNLRKKFN